MIFAWYLNKDAFGGKPSLPTEYSIQIQRISGGFPLMFEIPQDTRLKIKEEPFSVDDSVLYALNALLKDIASNNLGPTRTSRIIYLWFFSVVSSYSWVSSGKISGIKDNWNWDTHYLLESKTDIFIWINRILEEVMSIFVPSFNNAFILEKELEVLGWDIEKHSKEVSRIKESGHWDEWLSAWNTWYTNRQSDGSSSALTPPSDSELPNGSLSINVSTDTDDPNTFPSPNSWTPLIVNGSRKNYLTYNWGNVLSTCLDNQDQTSLLNAAQEYFFGPATPGSQKEEEIKNMLSISQNLTDEQKIQAEFWAGGPFTVSPPGMFIYFWSKYMKAYRPLRRIGFDSFFYSGLDLAIHLFEVGRLVWQLKKNNMEARPIQEIRRIYRGQTIKRYDGVDIQGELWVPYQTSNFVTPPFADFPSGHSAFSQSFANTMNSWFTEIIQEVPVFLDDLYLIAPTLNQNQTYLFGRFLFPKGQSEIENQIVPSKDILLSWSTWNSMAESAGLSRQYGGIHCASAHLGSTVLANELHQILDSKWSFSHS